METYNLTQDEFEELEAMILSAKRKANEVSSEGYQSGAEQDGHHDEAYQRSIQETKMMDSRVGELIRIRNSSRIIQTEEQKIVARVGNGVVVKFEDGSKETFRISGYVFNTESKYEKVSANSPLGLALIGSKSGNKKTFSVGEKRITVEILEILLPSQVR